VTADRQVGELGVVTAAGAERRGADRRQRLRWLVLAAGFRLG
jgi:hypothetical protein